MKEILFISEIQVLLDSNQISKVYIQIIEGVYGYYQLKEGVDSDKEPLQGVDWNELEGSPTDIGEYNPDKPIYQGYFYIINQHEVNLDWFKEKFYGFYRSDMNYEELHGYFHYQFIDYGREIGGFDMNSEMGLHGDGLNWSELKKTMKIILSTDEKQYNIETGLVCESRNEDVMWKFD